jgi:hypothetical protein
MSRPPTPIRRRIVLHVPGFEPLTPREHRDRFARTLARTASAWSIASGCGPLAPPAPAALPAFRASAKGPDWRTEAEFRLLAWDDLIRAELARPGPMRLLRGAGALGDMLLTGTIARYLVAHWRYALFALCPIALLAAIAAIAAAAGTAAGGAVGVALGLGVFAGLVALAGRFLHLDLMLADWSFAAAVARGRHAGYDARIARFAREIAEAVRRPDVDEVLLTGHSLGAVFAVEALAEALRRDPRLLRRGPRLALVGLGSSVLKIALHPAAGRLRAALARLAATPGLVWVDHSSRRDLLSFERAEPIATLGLPGRGPRLERVHPRDMVDPGTWSRIRRRPLRLHRQYVLGNARRYFLDFGLLVCGPLPVEPGLRPDRVLGPDGALGAGGVRDREASASVAETTA